MNARLLSRLLQVSAPPARALRLLRAGAAGTVVSAANAILLREDSPTTQVQRQSRYQWALVLAKVDVRSKAFLRRERRGLLLQGMLRDGLPLRAAVVALNELNPRGVQ